MMTQDFYAESRGAPFRCYAEKGSLSPTLSTREGAKSLPLWGRTLNMSACDNLTSVNKGVPLGLEGAPLHSLLVWKKISARDKRPLTVVR
ncbi:MAG: hypothetical protein KBS65_06065 [Prevotella sp.]|nr:hypothetical protein [Candidatus Equicola stercoris]